MFKPITGIERSYAYRTGYSIETSNTENGKLIADVSTLTTSYVSNVPWKDSVLIKYNTSKVDEYHQTYGKKSSDGKTIYWYQGYSAGYQHNVKDEAYYYVAIG